MPMSITAPMPEPFASWVKVNGHPRREFDVLFRFAGDLSADPPRDPRIEQIERKTAAGQHLVVKAADVEARSELLRGARAKLAHLQLAQLVAARLRRPRDVAVGLGLDR